MEKLSGTALVNNLTKSGDIVMLKSKDGKMFFINKDVAC